MVSESGYRSKKRSQQAAGSEAGAEVAEGVRIPSAAEQLASIASGAAVKEENRYPDRSQPSGPALGPTMQIPSENERIGVGAKPEEKS